MTRARTPSKSATAPRRGRLTRHAILSAALALVDREGADALSMRRLGQELGVEAMSIYNHIAGREELLDGLSEVMVEALPGRRGGSDWRAALLAFGTAIRRTAKKHPQAFLLVGMRPLRTPGALVPVDATLEALQRGGATPQQAVGAYRLVASYARGFALAEIAGFTLEAEDVRPSAATHPAVDVARAAPGALDHDRGFAFGLEVILAGLAAEIRPPR